MQIQRLSSPLFERLMKSETLFMDLCSILIGEPNILPLHFGSFWILLILCSPFQKKDIHSTMPAVNVSLNISKKKKQIANVTIPCKSYSFLYLNTSKDIIIPKDLMALLICLLQMKQRTYTGSRIPNLLSKTFILFCVYLLDYSSYRRSAPRPHWRIQLSVPRGNRTASIPFPSFGCMSDSFLLFLLYPFRILFEKFTIIT